MKVKYATPEARLAGRADKARIRRARAKALGLCRDCGDPIRSVGRITGYKRLSTVLCARCQARTAATRPVDAAERYNDYVRGQRAAVHAAQFPLTVDRRMRGKPAAVLAWMVQQRNTGDSTCLE